MADAFQVSEVIKAAAEVVRINAAPGLSPLERGRSREVALVAAVRAVAAACGVQLEPSAPCGINAYGELALTAAAGSTFGAFAPYLNAAGTRVGQLPFGYNAVMDEASKYCFINHFAAERMIKHAALDMVLQSDDAVRVFVEDGKPLLAFIKRPQAPGKIQVWTAAEEHAPADWAYVSSLPAADADVAIQAVAQYQRSYPQEAPEQGAAEAPDVPASS